MHCVIQGPFCQLRRRELNNWKLWELRRLTLARMSFRARGLELEVCFSVCLSVFLSFFVSFFLFFFFSFSLFPSLSLSLYKELGRLTSARMSFRARDLELEVFFSLFLSFCLSVFLPFCKTFCSFFSFSLSLFPPLSLSIRNWGDWHQQGCYSEQGAWSWRYVSLSFCLSAYLSFCHPLSVFLSLQCGIEETNISKSKGPGAGGLFPFSLSLCLSFSASFFHSFSPPYGIEETDISKDVIQSKGPGAGGMFLSLSVFLSTFVCLSLSSMWNWGD